MLTCLLTGQWHDDIMPTSSSACTVHHVTVHYATVHHVTVHMVGSTGIRVGSTHPGEEDAWGASARLGRRLAGE